MPEQVNCKGNKHLLVLSIYLLMYFVVVKTLFNYICFRQVGLCVRRLLSSRLLRRVALLLILATWDPAITDAKIPLFKTLSLHHLTEYLSCQFHYQTIYMFLFISLDIMLRVTEMAAGRISCFIWVGIESLGLRQLISLLYQLLTTGAWIWSIGGMVTGRRKPKYSRQKPVPVPFTHYKPHMD
jgi:hypothetical protein